MPGCPGHLGGLASGQLLPDASPGGRLLPPEGAEAGRKPLGPDLRLQLGHFVGCGGRQLALPTAPLAANLVLERAAGISVPTPSRHLPAGRRPSARVSAKAALPGSCPPKAKGGFTTGAYPHPTPQQPPDCPPTVERAHGSRGLTCPSQGPKVGDGTGGAPHSEEGPTGSERKPPEGGRPLHKGAVQSPWTARALTAWSLEPGSPEQSFSFCWSTDVGDARAAGATPGYLRLLIRQGTPAGGQHGAGVWPAAVCPSPRAPAPAEAAAALTADGACRPA